MRKATILLCALVVPFTAWGYSLHIGSATINLQTTCSSTHKLKVYDGTNTYCAEATTDTLTGALHVMHNGTPYSICNGACSGGGGTWVMPEEPEEPITLPSNCDWTQTDSGAYLLSDGNQYFDTGVTADTSVNLDVQVKIVNGLSARIFGTNSSSCFYDMTLDHKRRAQFRFGSANNAAATNFTEANSKKLLRFVTSDQTSTKKRIDYYIDGVKQSYFTRTYSSCTSSDTLKIFKNNLIADGLVDQTDSGGMKLYYIKVFNSSGSLIHEYQPVPQGANICGYTALTNAMWDTVTKKLYYPAGTGQMGYGTDTN
ncbi:MAG: hypothetical protein J5679_00755 [Alphaproteobacteria bacterium]|nr:hypothetical protein [Alphaproteobacteria bacterium]